jgi:hypothetical protein
VITDLGLRSQGEEPGRGRGADVCWHGGVAVAELGGSFANAELAHHRAPGLPRLELAGVLPQRRGGDSRAIAVSSGAVALRFAAAALGSIADGLPCFACEPSLWR